MTRASISSLVETEKGKSLLWIHMCLLFWVAITWMGTLVWVCHGAFRLRTRSIQQLAKKRREYLENPDSVDHTNYQHPHPQYNFLDVPSPDRNHANAGLRLRTIMVTNLPEQLRDEDTLKDYFEHFMSRKVEKPSIGIGSSTQPGFLNKSFAFLFNRAKKIPKKIPPHLPSVLPLSTKDQRASQESTNIAQEEKYPLPVIERVVVARKMTELASLFERREEFLRLLETAHIKLANKALAAVKEAMDRRAANKALHHHQTRASAVVQRKRVSLADQTGVTPVVLDDQETMDKLIEVLSPFVREFGLDDDGSPTQKRPKLPTRFFKRLRRESPSSSDSDEGHQRYGSSRARAGPADSPHKTIWDALVSLPRSTLDAYQPLVRLSHLFRGKPVPAIDYYTMKLNLMTSLITENRSKAVADYDPVSTAFVTFANPADAKRACKYLAVHPKNPLECLVTMAPEYQDLDWIRVMKSTFQGEFIKDWAVNIGVWAFTLFWLFPVSFMVGLVSIQNISLFWPSLKRYLDRHPWQSEVIQSFIPTLLVALLALLIPLILLLIAKKAHTITTLSALHDLIMTRYYKFLIVNVLVFFCVGTAALQSVLQSFKNVLGLDWPQIVATSFPTAGPFYVGWLIFTTAIHGGTELLLLGLPLIMYPSTSRQVTPRKRRVGVRPRTLNYYYWLPNHLLVIHVLLLFAVLNPFVLPFGALYFFVQAGVIKNQLIHVYAKHYEGNGKTLLIRLCRYSLDGLTFAVVVFLAYMVVLKKSGNVGGSIFLIVFTVIFKLILTRMCRARFERDDIAEAEAATKETFTEIKEEATLPEDPEAGISGDSKEEENCQSQPRRSFFTVKLMKLPDWIDFSYGTLQQRPKHNQRRKPIPFREASLDKEPKLASTSAQPRNDVQRSRSRSDPRLQPIHDETPWNASSSSSQPKNNKRPHSISLDVETFGPVVDHPPPLPWDDLTPADLPYNNPYYTRAFDNILWLPRNPTGILDLDNTVDLKVSLTVDVPSGRLGTWFNLFETASPDELTTSQLSLTSHPTITVTRVSPVTPPLSIQSLPFVDGTEDIDLPSTIRRRVAANENDIEQASSPSIRARRSTFTRPRAGTVGESGTLGLPSVSPSALRKYPSTLEPRAMPSRSASDGHSNQVSRARSASFMSILSGPSPPVDQELGVRPDAHAQAELAAVVSNHSRTSLAPRSGSSRPQNISAQEAIFHEVLAEEEMALIDRLETEMAEAEKAKASKSWLISWMFNRSSK